MRLVHLATMCGAAVALGAGCTRVQGTSASRDLALRAELLHRVARDQAVRDTLTAVMRGGRSPDSALIGRVQAVDADNTAWLARIVVRRGWPGKSAVGHDGADAAFLLVQHADADTAFQARALPLLERAYKAGETTGQQVALLTDRLASARGHLQVYGTQADIRDGRVLLKPIADSAHVDERRAAAGLPTLREYVRVLDSVYMPAGRQP